MAKVVIRSFEQAQLLSPSSDVDGVTGYAYFNSSAQPIEVLAYHFARSAVLRLRADSTPLTIYVQDGSVDALGTRLDAGACSIVPCGTSIEFRTDAKAAALLVFRGEPSEGAAAGRPVVQLLAADQVPRSSCLGGNVGIGGAMFANAQPPVEHVWLHETSWATGGAEVALHSHSENEVIFVIGGAIRLGNRLYGPGTALAIAAEVKYAFHTGPDGLTFLNFRNRPPTYSTADGAVVKDEAKLWNDLLGHPKYVEAVAS